MTKEELEAKEQGWDSFQSPIQQPPTPERRRTMKKRDWRTEEVPDCPECGGKVVITPSICGKSVLVDAKSGWPVAGCLKCGKGYELDMEDEESGGKP